MVATSKSTDKLVALEAILEKTPLERVKEIDIIWQEVDTIVVPFLHVEYFESVEAKEKADEDS